MPDVLADLMIPKVDRVAVMTTKPMVKPTAPTVDPRLRVVN